MLLAGVLRLYELGSWPPGLYHDEAFNGLDALRVIGGERPLYFAANHGREPFFIYLVALSVEWLGRTVYALRFPSALLGILTIPVTYWMARELFNRRIGLLTAAFMTITLWPLHLSLVSFRAESLPLFLALSMATGVRAYRSDRRLDWLIAGALYGASFYTYLASRFTPLALIVFGLGLILSRRVKRLWPGALIFIIAAGLVMAPLVITAVTNWEVVMGRPGDLSILNPAINGGDLIGTAIGNTFKVLGLFFWQGDGIPRHNVPYRPVFDGLVTIVFVFGLIRLILGAIQRRPRYAPLPDFLNYAPIARVSLPAKLPSVWVLLWIGVMLLPTILAEDTPHFLRAVGILPVLMVIPAIGLDTLAQWVSVRARALSGVLIVGVLAVSTAQTLADYARYAADPATAYAFEAAATSLAASARGGLAANYRVFIAERLVRDYPSVPYLVDQPFEAVPDGTQPAPIARGAKALFFLWPYEDWWLALQSLDGPHAVRVTAGPLARGDRDPQPFYAYVRAQAEPVSMALVPEARFANGAQLLGHSIERLDDTHWRLRTLWQRSADGTDPLTADDTFFVHLLAGGQLVVAQDGDTGDGFYPIRLWRPGDVIIDERTLEIAAGLDRPQLLIELGLYDRVTMQRVAVIDSAQAVINNAVLLGGPAGDIGP